MSTLSSTSVVTQSASSNNQPNNTIYPLAFPKGVKLLCELCQKPAHKVCDKCRVTYYCDNDHKKSDWYGIHEQICQYLIPIRSQLTFLPSEEERKKRDAQIRQKQIELIEFTRSIAKRYLFEGDYQRAIPGAMFSLKLVIDIYGLKSVDMVPSYLILGEASQGLGSLTQAQEYLSQAEWTVLKNPQCPLAIIAKLYRNIAMLKMAQGHYDDALRHLANDVYYASEEYGTDNYQVSGGYFLMANIFFKMGKMQVADSLYRQVIVMWYTHLSKLIEEATRVSELDAILGKKTDENENDDKKLDPKRVEELASAAEANKILYSIYELRKNEQVPDMEEINRIEHSLAMLHFLAKEMEKFEYYSNGLLVKDDLSQTIKDSLVAILTYINMKL